MTAHAPEAAKVLISLDGEDYDWSVSVLLGSINLCELSL